MAILPPSGYHTPPAGRPRQSPDAYRTRMAVSRDSEHTPPSRPPRYPRPPAYPQRNPATHSRRDRHKPWIWLTHNPPARNAPCFLIPKPRPRKPARRRRLLPPAGAPARGAGRPEQRRRLLSGRRNRRYAAPPAAGTATCQAAAVQPVLIAAVSSIRQLDTSGDYRTPVPGPESSDRYCQHTAVIRL